MLLVSTWNGFGTPGGVLSVGFGGFLSAAVVRESWAVGRSVVGAVLLARCSNYGRASKGNRKCCTSWLDKPLKEGRLTAHRQHNLGAMPCI